MMNKLNYFIICITFILIICGVIHLYKKYRNKESFYQLNPILIKDIETLYPYTNSFINAIDITKTPKHGDILRVNNNNKYEPYEFSKLAYTVGAILKLTSTQLPLLSKESFNGTTYDIPVPKYIIGDKIQFSGLTETNNNGIITINPDCNYKVTLISVMYIHDISVATDILLFIYGNDKPIFLNKTYLYVDPIYLTMVTTTSINKTDKFTKITPKIQLASGTYAPNNKIDTTISIIVEEC